MLGGAEDAFTLYASNESRCDRTGQEWVLAEVLEVASVERGALNVHAGSEQDVNTARATVVSDSLPHALGQRVVERGGEGDGSGEGGIGTPVAASRWSVGHFDLGDAEARDGANVEVAIAADVSELF